MMTCVSDLKKPREHKHVLFHAAALRPLVDFLITACSRERINVEFRDVVVT